MGVGGGSIFGYKQKITIKINTGKTKLLNYSPFHLAVLPALQLPNSVNHEIYFAYALKYPWASRFSSQLSFHFTVCNTPGPSPYNQPIIGE